MKVCTSSASRIQTTCTTDRTGQTHIQAVYERRHRSVRDTFLRPSCGEGGRGAVGQAVCGGMHAVVSVRAKAAGWEWEHTSSSECQHSSKVFRTCTEHISAVAGGGTPPTGLAEARPLINVCHPDASRGRVDSPRTLLSTPLATKPMPRLGACELLLSGATSVSLQPAFLPAAFERVCLVSHRRSEGRRTPPTVVSSVQRIRTDEQRAVDVRFRCTPEGTWSRRRRGKALGRPAARVYAVERLCGRWALSSSSDREPVEAGSVAVDCELCTLKGTRCGGAPPGSQVCRSQYSNTSPVVDGQTQTPRYIYVRAVVSTHRRPRRCG